MTDTSLKTALGRLEDAEISSLRHRIVRKDDLAKVLAVVKAAKAYESFVGKLATGESASLRIQCDSDLIAVAVVERMAALANSLTALEQPDV